jgi:hypothetical protein
MTMDQAEFTWESTPYSDAASAPAASQHTARSGRAVAVLRAVALLFIATLAILVLLPAAIAAQAVFAV